MSSCKPFSFLSIYMICSQQLEVLPRISLDWNSQLFNQPMIRWLNPLISEIFSSILCPPMRAINWTFLIMKPSLPPKIVEYGVNCSFLITYFFFYFIFWERNLIYGFYLMTIINRYEKRHSNIPAHISPCFRVKEGDHVIIGQCRLVLAYGPFIPIR